MKLLVRGLAWAGLAAIAIVTLSPVGLRPHVPQSSPYLEYVGTFAVIGALFGLGYSRHLLAVAVLVVVAAVGLELAQMLTPDRHGRLLDGAAKFAGGLIGVGAAWIWSRWRTAERSSPLAAAPQDVASKSYRRNQDSE